MPKHPTRALGRNGPQVTAIGFGAMSLSGSYGPMIDDDARFAFLDHLYEVGETNWDTADMYGDSEDLLSQWFKKTGKRDEIFLASKFGFDHTMAVHSDPEYIRMACNRSLKRLGIGCIDLYYAHRVDGKTPVEKTVEAMVELKKEGKIKYLGLSEVSANTLRRAYAVHPISAVQVEYSPFALDIESPQIGLMDACRELGVAVVAYSPIGRGFLTGNFKKPEDLPAHDFRRGIPRFQGENFYKNLVLVDQIAEMAKKKGCTSGQLCLAWLLKQGDYVIPIPGTKRIKYADENLGALKVELTEEEVKEMRKNIEAVQIEGERYPSKMMAEIFGETPPL